MDPSIETHIQRLRWISETERYLARAQRHCALCPGDLEAKAVTLMVEDALTKARSEIGVADGTVQ